MRSTDLYFPLLVVPALAAPVANSTVYFANLATYLTAAGLDSLLDALSVANTTTSGKIVLDALYSDNQSTPQSMR